jgi:hypothetical protein
MQLIGILILLAVVLFMLVFILMLATTSDQDRKNDLEKTQKEYPIGSRVEAQEDDRTEGGVVIRKGMRGVVKEVYTYSLIVEFDGLPFEMEVPAYVFRKRS